MFSKTVKYKDFDDVEVEDVVWFGLSKTELQVMEAGDADRGIQPDPWTTRMSRISNSKNVGAIIHEVQQLMLLAYGVPSEDGRTFEKNEELRNKFKNSIVFDVIFQEFATDTDALVKFVIGILPKDLREEFEESMRKQKQTPTPPRIGGSDPS